MVHLVENFVLASAMTLDHVAVSSDQIVSGNPTTASADLHDFEGQPVGVWEMSVGAMSDTEVDEVFVVLSGVATVEFVDDGRVVTLAPGTVGRLSAGERTIWTVTETLRKVYFA